MDSPPGHSQRSLAQVASDGRSVSDLAELPSSRVLFSQQRFDGSRLRCLFPVVGRHASLRLPIICAGQGSPQQGSFVSESYVNPGGSLVATKGVVPGPSESRDCSSGVASIPSRFAPPTTLPTASSSAPRALTSCVETVQRFARELVVSRAVARQLAQCHRPSSQRLYQHCWQCYREWCVTNGHTISSTSIPKVADFLVFLRKLKHLVVFSVKGFRSMLSSVFKFHLP